MNVSEAKFFFSSHRRKFIIGLMTAPFFEAKSSIAQVGSGNPRYIGSVVAEWSTTDRTMKLVKPFEFIDPAERRWPVPVGAKIDGASIPQIFWSLIGGPYDDLYRAASVIHDYYCDSRTRKYTDVHRVFFDAMIVSGVGRSKAWLMYNAVMKFGPNWPNPKIDPRCEIPSEDYDFDLCAKNTVTPQVEFPIITRSKLDDFAKEMKGQIEEEDFKELRRAIEKET